jgi:hypothetical protein
LFAALEHLVAARVCVLCRGFQNARVDGNSCVTAAHIAVTSCVVLVFFVDVADVAYRTEAFISKQFYYMKAHIKPKYIYYDICCCINCFFDFGFFIAFASWVGAQS